MSTDEGQPRYPKRNLFWSCIAAILFAFLSSDLSEALMLQQIPSVFSAKPVSLAEEPGWFSTIAAIKLAFWLTAGSYILLFFKELFASRSIDQELE